MSWKYVQRNENGQYKTTEGGGGGGSSTFADLEDVSFSNLQNGQVPKYNSSTQKWENANESGGGGSVTDVKVDGVSVVNGQGVAEITSPTVPDDLSDLSDVQFNNLSDHQPLRYNATSQKWVNGVDSYPPLIYSDNEREIGVWRDGKPLYQKTYVTQNATVNSAVTMADLTSLNIDTVVDYYGEYNRYVSGTSDDIIYKFNSYQSSTINNWLRVLNKNTLQYQINQNSSAESTSYQAVTILYTKTTDTAGSGSWTTQGTPTHHYSTAEQVVGTWINGKPLYEKTFGTTTPSSSNLEISVADITSLNIDSVISTNGYCLLTSDYFIPLGFYGSSNSHILAYSTKTAIICNAGSAYVSKAMTVTIQYTKTTD